MDPIFKKYLELFISISFLFILWFFLLYSLYFSSLCNNYSWYQENSLGQSILKLSSCNDNLICEINNMKNKNNKPYNWSCKKKEIFFLEWDFYIWKIDEIIIEYWN